MKKSFRWIRKLICLCLCLVLFVALGIGALMGVISVWETVMPTNMEYDSIIVLGAQVLPTGEPSVQLQWRLDKAFEYYEKQPCPIVVCGGQGAKEPEPEGDVMLRYLIAKGVRKEHVISDPVSEDTRQNLRNAGAILQELDCTQPIIVTSDYHLPRALALAEDEGVHAQGVGSPCKSGFRFWFKNHFREALAWVKYVLVKFFKLPL